MAITELNNSSMSAHKAGVALQNILSSTAVASSTTSRQSTSSASRDSISTQILTQKEADQKPWKFIGYKGYSEFIASDNDFFILRRFGPASARVALRLQDKVAVLVEQLRDLDKQYSLREADDIHNGYSGI
jgi:hypothetical protein